jgi:hypothetical protein
LYWRAPLVMVVAIAVSCHFIEMTMSMMPLL